MASSCNANRMFVREKRIGSYSYLYLVETVRENGKTKQRIIRNLGRKEVVEAGGDLDRLARSAARLSQRSTAVFAFGKRGANNSAPVSNYLISKGFDFDGVKVGPSVHFGVRSTTKWDAPNAYASSAAPAF